MGSVHERIIEKAGELSGLLCVDLHKGWKN